MAVSELSRAIKIERNKREATIDPFNITGARSVLGYEIARSLASMDCNLILGATSQPKYDAIGNRLQAYHRPFVGDLRDSEVVANNINLIAGLDEFQNGTFQRMHVIHTATAGIPGKKERRDGKGTGFHFLKLIKKGTREGITFEQSQEVKREIREFLKEDRIMQEAIELNYTAPLRLIEEGIESGLIDSNSMIVTTSSWWSEIARKYIIDNNLQNMDINEIYGMEIPNVPAFYNVAIPKAMFVLKIQQMAREGKFKSVDFVIREIEGAPVENLLGRTLWPATERLDSGVKRPESIPVEEAGREVAKYVAYPPARQQSTLYIEKDGFSGEWKATYTEPQELKANVYYPI